MMIIIIHVCYSIIYNIQGTCTYIVHVHVYKRMYMYMKIHVPSMLAIVVDKHTQQTNKQPQWLH